MDQKMGPGKDEGADTIYSFLVFIHLFRTFLIESVQKYVFVPYNVFLGHSIIPDADIFCNNYK